MNRDECGFGSQWYSNEVFGCLEHCLLVTDRSDGLEDDGEM